MYQELQSDVQFYINVNSINNDPVLYTFVHKINNGKVYIYYMIR